MTTTTTTTTEERSEYFALKNLILTRFTQLEDALTEMRLPELTSTKPHPLDDPSTLVSKPLYEARSQLEAALGQMASLIRNPAEHLMSEALSHHTSAALCFAEKSSLADRIAASPQKKLHVDELAKQIDSHPVRITHALRLLAHDSIFAEVEEGVFENNRSSLMLVGKDSPSRHWVRYTTWFGLGYAGKVAETWMDPVKSKSFKHADSAGNAGWHYSEKGYSNFWDWIYREHPSYAHSVSDAIKSYGDIGVMGTLADYPWDSVKSGGLVVDVGGGSGHLLLPVLKYNPTLNGVLQERAEIISAAKANFRVNLPGANVKYDTIDFFEEQPRKAADIYLLRWILHDWNDEDALAILKQLAKAMGPRSKMLVIDALVAPATRASTQDPCYPLLQSRAQTSDLVLRLDFEIGANMQSKERSLGEFEALFKQAGLKVSRVCRPRSPQALLEVVLA